MTLPHTPWPNRSQESIATNESTSTQIFGVMYITLTGLIDSMVPMSGPWAVLGKLLSYIVKLASILWWALPAGPAGRTPASSQEPPTGWIPDTQTLFNSHFVNKFKLTTNPLQIKNMVLADKHHIAVSQETVPFSITLKNLHSTIQ
ncbi:hypothetical protein DSO57_1023212 [Entomophthora muscae]|uniref:Uncharacterized protein n=1 Tax=Entomophthora muscae TaxID=34485 RepID=A0ACC2SS78_9FUNG|nr:hypothetical protein DSO57_1023212 [Entomophthora muscae]